jgi:TetR/AcrR family transcriptional repressor of nem operon
LKIPGLRSRRSGRTSTGWCGICSARRGRQGCLLVNSAIENAATDPEVAAVVRGHLARLEHCFTGALRTAIRRGEVPASVDPASRAKGLVATSQGLMVVGKANPDEELLRAIVDNAFTGLS